MKKWPKNAFCGQRVNFRGQRKFNDFEGWPDPWICFRRKTDEFESVVARRKHTLGFSILHSAFQCHVIVEDSRLSNSSRFEVSSASCSYEQCSAEFCVVSICKFSRTILCTSSALFDLIIIPLAASLKTLSQHHWWQLDVLADDHDKTWMWWSEICSIKPKLSKFAKYLGPRLEDSKFVYVIVEVIPHFQILGVVIFVSESCSYEQCSPECLSVRICQFSGTVLCTPQVLIASDNSACVVTAMRRSALEAFILEEDSNPSPSNAKLQRSLWQHCFIVSSYSQLEHSICHLAQGTGCANPSNTSMAEFTF